jgi:arylsulfatase A-like enzyme
MVRWPDRVKAGESDALMCQIDFLSSLASLTGRELAADDAPDSFNILSALLGKSSSGRDHLVEHAGTLSLIKGHWKYIEPSDGPKIARNVNIELGNDPQPQLYDLENDLGERHNLAAEHPEIVRELASLLEKIRSEGRSRPLR